MFVEKNQCIHFAASRYHLRRLWSLESFFRIKRARVETFSQAAKSGILWPHSIPTSPIPPPGKKGARYQLGLRVNNLSHA